jgi:hypothetical protein
MSTANQKPTAWAHSDCRTDPDGLVDVNSTPTFFLKSPDRSLKDRVHVRVESPLKEKSSWRQKESVLASLEQMCATAGGAMPTFLP